MPGECKWGETEFWILCTACRLLFLVHRGEGRQPAVDSSPLLAPLFQLQQRCFPVPYFHKCSPQRSGVRPQASPRSFSTPPDLAAQYRQAGITPLHEGYQLLLDLHLPVLAEEAAQCIALVFPKSIAGSGSSGSGTTGSASAVPAASGPTKSVRFSADGGTAATERGGVPQSAPAAPDAAGHEVQTTLASLLAGIQGELVGLIDGIKPQRLLLCLPMLCATLAWRLRLQARGPVTAPLAQLLAACEARLAALLDAYFADRCLAIQR